jgi:hypothetical protein
MQTQDIQPQGNPPSRRSNLARYALWSGGLTVGVPVVWAVLTSLGGNASLGIGWFGVLPVLILVPVGVIVTICLGIAAAVQPKGDGAPPAPGKPDGNDPAA